MKKHNSRQSAFFNLRGLTGLALCLLGATLAFFAYNGLTGPSAQAQGGSSQPDKVNLSAPVPPNLGPITPIRTGPLREMAPIRPSTAPGHDHPEPMQPRAPTQGGGPDTARQKIDGKNRSAPAPAGVSFDGVGVGLAGFAPSSNPPDVNGRVGATQYVQWNNTSFAIFDKTSGALALWPCGRQHALSSDSAAFALRITMATPWSPMTFSRVAGFFPSSWSMARRAVPRTSASRSRRPGTRPGLLSLRLRHRPGELRRLPAHRGLAGWLLHGGATSSIPAGTASSLLASMPSSATQMILGQPAGCRAPISPTSAAAFNTVSCPRILIA